MVYVELTESQMIHDLMGDDNASWSYNQAEAIVDFFVEAYGYQDGQGSENHEWDPVAIRCEFSGYDSIEEAEKEYDLDSDDKLENNTLVLFCMDGEVVVQDF